MLKLLRAFIALSFVSMLAACGGGGGGGASSGGAAKNGNFNLSPTTLTFTGTAGSYLSSQNLYVSSVGPDAYNIYIGAPAGSSWPSWLNTPYIYITGPDSGYASLSVNTYGLLPGTYNATVRIATTDASDGLLTYKDATVSLIITSATSSSSSRSSSNTSSTSSTSSSPGGASSASSTSSAASSAASSVAPAITANPSPLSFGGAQGHAFSSASTLYLAANKSGGNWAWSITSKPAWLTVQSSSSGTLTGTTASTLQLQGNPDGLGAGQYSGTLVLQAVVASTTVSASVPVSINVDKRKLIASDTGVALSTTPGWSRLSRSVTITDNFGAGSWVASSDKSWLSVTPSGNSGGILTLTANPAGLSADSLQTATVTISSNNGAAAETITVGLWNGSTTPGSQIIVSGSFTNVAADPVRPWIYVDSGGSTLSIYHQYTGALVGTVTGLSNAGAIEVRPDGQRVYVVTGHTISIVDPVARTVTGSLSNAGLDVSQTLRIARVNGENFLFASGNGIFRLSTGSAVSGYSSPYGPALAAAWDGSALLSQDTGISPGGVTKYLLDFSELSGTGVLSMSASDRASGGSNCKDVAVTRDASPQIITACGSPYNFPVFLWNMQATGIALNGTTYPNSVKVASDGRIFAGTSNWYDPLDFWVYRQDFSLFGSYKVHGYALAMLDRQLVPSGDALMAAALTAEPALHLIPIGPDTSSSSSSTATVSSAGLSMTTPSATQAHAATNNTSSSAPSPISAVQGHAQFRK